MFENVNLESALHDLRQRHSDTESQIAKTLESFQKLFQADWESDMRIQDALNTGSPGFSTVESESLDPDRIFKIETIKSLCIKYRLRFLPTKFFNPAFPTEAIRAIKNLEKELGTEIKSFYIAAPSPLFNLEDANKDPLLFCPLEDGRFYLIYKWGNDLAWYRKIAALPFRNFTNLCISISGFSLIMSILMPGHLVSYSPHFFSMGRLLFMVLMILSTSAIVSYLWFVTNQRFSSDSWKSGTFN